MFVTKIYCTESLQFSLVWKIQVISFADLNRKLWLNPFKSFVSWLVKERIRNVILIVYAKNISNYMNKAFTWKKFLFAWNSLQQPSNNLIEKMKIFFESLEAKLHDTSMSTKLSHSTLKTRLLLSTKINKWRNLNLRT